MTSAIPVGVTGKVYGTVAAALADVLRDGLVVMSGGFGLCGIEIQRLLQFRFSLIECTAIEKVLSGRSQFRRCFLPYFFSAIHVFLPPAQPREICIARRDPIDHRSEGDRELARYRMRRHLTAVATHLA